MAKVRWSFCVAYASSRPLYWACEMLFGSTVLKSATSGTPSSPLPTPGVPELFPYVKSCVPSPVFSGDPTSSPCGVVAHCTPSVNPIVEQLAAIMPLLATPSPGYARYFAAMLPACAADEANADVSYHPCEV